MASSELHIISTGKQPIEKLAEIATEIQEYVDFFHLREKQMSALQLYQAVNILTEKNIPLSKIIINDRVDVAWTMKTFGVQLAFHSLDSGVVKQAFPGIRVGSSIHSVNEAKEVSEKGVDYAIYGHVFPTNSKLDLPPKGIEGLKEITGSTSMPIIAIGGIKPSNCSFVLEAGAKGIAVMSGVLEAEDPLQAVKEYSKALGKRV
ncbi:thiamine phosphate synthase [Bacillus sp. FJAT-29790]|uniref:thiamine phosphate synthase n=1 Tax=Bacillus sp. FJAT-29790 TaxID=1895002 RepID=UPI001C21BB97|nr:thiamine phosphate synthase [Bacillus sp. FJAT-29790]MBU8878790.1 thiamine phosphate synthase [Bacillus sp. FJAT-29790]